MKDNKGITLIALVITIIVLLILAGVSIAMLTGDNGLLTKANNSKTETLKAEAVEKINMEAQALYADLLSGRTGEADTEIAKRLNANNNGINYTVTGSGTGPYTFSASGEGISVTSATVSASSFTLAK